MAETDPIISFNQQLATLPVGRSVAVARRFRPCGDDFDLNAEKQKLRQTVNPQISRARTKYNADYVADTGDYITSDGHMVVAVTVTRLQ